MRSMRSRNNALARSKKNPGFPGFFYIAMDQVPTPVLDLLQPPPLV
jgi:hypothetical protein